MNKIVLFLIPLILSIGITPSLSFADHHMVMSPRKQMANGVAAEDVVCKAGLALMIRSTGDAACVKPATAEKLAAADWGTIEKQASMIETQQEDKRPNILVILLDDVGFSDLGFTAGEIDTPVMNSLAENEILLTNFHVSPTCSPTRAMMLTGVDNHLNGLGTMAEHLAKNQEGVPGYETYLNYNVVTAPTLLRDAGYNTFMTGKWHLSYGHTMNTSTTDFDAWAKYDPYARGFSETFTAVVPGGHMGIHQSLPGIDAIYNRNGEKVELPDDFWTAKAYTAYMIDFIDMHHNDGKPMYMYLAFWESHWPLQVPQEYIDKYDGVYDKGWDEIRKERFELQKELGLIDPNMELPPRLDEIPSWDELTPVEQAIQAKKMQVFAGMTDAMDENIGRLIQHLKNIGEYDNTLIFIFSDNGAEAVDSSKLGVTGEEADVFIHWLSRFDNSLENIGAEDSYVSLGLGWAQVGSTPLHREKRFTTEGGTLAPMIVKLPNNSVNQKSHAFSHVVDITPTILDYADVEHPGNYYDGRDINPLTGKSLRPLLEGKTDRIYGDDEPFGAELFGNRALYKGNWKILYTMPPIGDETWQLFNLAKDIRELNDLSNQFPEKLQELINDYNEYAERVGIIHPEGFGLSR